MHYYDYINALYYYFGFLRNQPMPLKKTINKKNIHISIMTYTALKYPYNMSFLMKVTLKLLLFFTIIILNI